MSVKKDKNTKLLTGKENTWKYDLQRNWPIYVLFIPVLIYFLIFHYAPMFGLIMAFENFKPSKGFFGSQFVGLANFQELFTGDTFWKVLRNTTCMAVLNLTVGFAAPVLFAMLLSQVRMKKLKRGVQLISYMPYFVSATVVCALTQEFLQQSGAVTKARTFFGFESQNWLTNPKIPVFWLINTFIGIWQNMGWGSIIYVAAIANVSADLHDAAAIDGANRWQRMWKITFPTILPLILVMWIMRIGLVFKTGFDKILLLYKPVIYDTADCLYTYTYRMAFGAQINYGVSTASGLFQSIIGTTLLLVSNKISKKASGSSLM